MKRTFVSVASLLIVAVMIMAVFLYGKHQREVRLKQDAQKQHKTVAVDKSSPSRERTSSPAPGRAPAPAQAKKPDKSQSTPAASSNAKPSAPPDQQPATNKPSDSEPSNLQGSGATQGNDLSKPAQKTPEHRTATAPATAPSPRAAPTTSRTAASPTPPAATPATGGSVLDLLGLAAIGFTFHVYLRSRQSLQRAYDRT